MKSGEGLKTKTFIFCKKFESIAYWVSLDDKPIIANNARKSRQEIFWKWKPLFFVEILNP